MIYTHVKLYCLYHLYVYIKLCDIGIEDMILGDEKMKQIGNEIYELSKGEYERMKEKAVLGQNNNASEYVRNYFILKTKQGTMNLIGHELSLRTGSKPSYMLYRNVTPQQVQEFSGIPLDKFTDY